MHAAAIHADDRLGQEGRGQSHVGGDLAADQFVELNLVGGGDDFAVTVVDFKLRGSDFGVVFFVLESHGALHFGSGVDKSAQGIAGQRVIVAAGVDVFEFAGFVIMALGVGAFEEEALNFVGGVEGVALFLEQILGVSLEHAANVAGVGCAALVDDFAEHQHLAGAEDIGGRPVERAPVDAEAQVAFALCGEAADRRAVEGEVVPALEQELLVVVEHVQPAFEIAEEHGHGLDPLFVGQVLEAVFLDLVRCDAVPALLLRLKVEIFQFVVGECQEIAQFSGHGCPSVSFA